MNSPFVDSLWEHSSYLNEYLPDGMKAWFIRMSGEDLERFPWSRDMAFKIIFQSPLFQGMSLVQVSPSGEMIPTKPWNPTHHAALRAWRDDMQRSFMLGPKPSS